MPEILNLIKSKVAEFNRRQRFARFVVVPPNYYPDEPENREPTFIPEASDYFNFFVGQEGFGQMVIDVPKRLLKSNGTLDPNKAQVAIITDPTTKKRSASLWINPSE